MQVILAANALQQPRLSFVRGPVRILHHGHLEFTLQVEGVEFDVDGNPSGAFDDGKEYTIYYVEPKREILSIEE